MAQNLAFATKITPEVLRALDDVCERFGLRKNYVVEQALREKIEDILDAFELEEARKSATTFTDWTTVQQQLRRKGKL